MTTTVVKTIGTASRDYSTLQAWEDAAPASLVTADQVWKGECYNDSTFTAGLTISGITTDATRYVWLTAAAGQSFADHPSNALDYNAANGVTIVVSEETIVSSVANVKIDRLQTSGSLGISDTSGSSAVYIDNCIVKTSHYTTGGGCVKTAGNVSNCVLINTGGGTAVIGFGSAKFFNVTAIQTGAASAYGFRGDYSTPKYTNCAAFGFGTNFRSGYDSASDYNASSQASPPGSHSLGSLTFSDHFVSTSDYKLKTTSTLINAGTSTGAPATDIFGTARPSGASYDIGAFEYVASGGTTAVYSDAYAVYLIRNAVTNDEAATFSIRGALQADTSQAFNVRGAVPIDLSAAYSLRGLTQSDASPIYAVRGAASADITPTYSIMSAGSVVSDLSPNFAVRGIAQGDLASAYNLCGQTQQDLTQNYALRGASATDLSASYEVAGAANAVQQDLTVSYSVFGVAVACPTAADIAAAVRVELTAELARIDATISSRSTVAAIMGYTAP